MMILVLFRGFGGFLLLGDLPALAQLVGDGLQARRGLGGGLDVVVDMGGLLHDLAAYREAGIVYLRGDRRGHGVDVGELGKEIDVVLEFGCFESSREDIRVVLGGTQGVLDERNTIGTCFEDGSPFLGRQVDEEVHSCEDFLEGGLDGLYFVGREGCIDVLVWSGGAPWGWDWFSCERVWW